MASVTGLPSPAQPPTPTQECSGLLSPLRGIRLTHCEFRWKLVPSGGGGQSRGLKGTVESRWHLSPGVGWAG